MISISDDIFKAYDIRGIVDKTLTPEIVTLLGKAIGTTAVAQGLTTFVIGRDGRLSGSDYRDALSKGITSTGIDVIDVGSVPTPVLSFAIHHFKADGGVMITGSHNPKDYNGFKITFQNGPLFGDQIQALKQLIESGHFAEGRGNYRKEDIVDHYIDAVSKDVHLKRPMTIVIDSGNGIAGRVAPDLYRKLGCEVIELFSEVDGHFPNHHPDPAKPENLQDVIYALGKTSAEIGLAFDGDGDRLGVVTKDEEIIFPDRQMMLFAKNVLQQHPGAPIIFDVKSTQCLSRFITEHGGQAVMSRTGHSYLRAKMREIQSPLAGEMSGHIFFADRWYGFDDALYAGARLLEILSQSEDITSIFNTLPKSVSTPELNISMTEGEPAKLVNEIISRKCHFKNTVQISGIDGLRVDYDDGFGLVRSSNTTPVLVLRFEGHTQDAMLRIQNEFMSLLTELMPTLSIPVTDDETT